MNPERQGGKQSSVSFAIDIEYNKFAGDMLTNLKDFISNATIACVNTHPTSFLIKLS